MALDRATALRIAALLASGASAAVAVLSGDALLIALSVLGFGLLLLLLRAGAATAERKPTPAGARTDVPDFRRALDALPSPVLLVDRRAIVSHANPAARLAFPGLRNGAALSATLRDPDLLAGLDSVLKGEPEAALELVERVPVERSFAVTLRRLPESPLVMLHLAETSKARQVERMRADFVANASHELRTPLATILGFVETLQGPAKDDAAAQARFLAIIAAQAQRMSRLISDLLSLSRLEMKAHLQPVDPVDLASVAAQVLESLGGLADERHLRLEADVNPGEPLLVPGDRDDLLRLLENLVENAIKYGGSGGRVVVRARLEAGEARLQVRDFGPGIAPEHLPRLTERFYRIDSTESRVQGGTGLGLALCKSIVSRHRGRLEIESPARSGTLVTVTLPVYKIQE